MKRLVLRWTENRIAMQDIGDETTCTAEENFNRRQAMQDLWLSAGLYCNPHVDVESVRFTIEED